MNTFVVLSLISAIVMTVLGILLFTLRIKDTPVTKKLSLMCKVMSLSYFMLSFPGYYTFVNCCDFNPVTTALLVMPMIPVQALFFSFSLIMMMTPKFIVIRRIWLHFVFFAMGALFFVVLYIWLPYRWIYFLALAAIVIQMSYYTKEFLYHYRNYISKMEVYNIHDEYSSAWLRYGFFSALIIGVLAVVSTLLPQICFIIFMSVYLFFYIWFATRIFNFISHYSFSIPVHASSSSEKYALSDSVSMEKNSEEELEEKLSRLNKTLQKWVEQKGYLTIDQDREYLIEQSHTDIDFFRWFFQNHMSCEFRSWRANLRIEEAKRLIAQDPEISMNELSARLGFQTSQNFYKHFKKNTGVTPKEYQQSLKKS